jgi:hypothetical protein
VTIADRIRDGGRVKGFAIGLIVIGLGGFAAAGHGHSGGGGHSSSSHSSRSHTASSGTGASSSAHSVRGYSTKRGTNVAPHRQSNADSTQRNNWSTKGNTNPDTGRAGRKTATH